MSAENPRCQITSGETPAVDRPWAGDPRSNAKDTLLEYALNWSDGTPIVCAVRKASGLDSEVGSADYQLARRFYTEDYAHLFKITRQDGFVWVEPRDVAFFLKKSRQTSADGSAKPPNPSKATGSLPSRAPSGKAATNARSILRDRCEITPGSRGARVRAALRHTLAAHRKGVDTDGMRSDRVSDPNRVAAQQATYLSAWEVAARQYRHGALVTLTARPGESGDMVDSAVAVNESVGPLRSHLRRQTPGSSTPDAIVSREFTNRGVLHLHVVVFGIRPDTLDVDALSRYWHETRGHGYIVDVAGIERRPTRTPTGSEFRWVFSDHATAPTDRGQYVRSYLGETLFQLRAVAEATPEEIHRTDNAAWWKVAVFWACGLPVVSVSSELRLDDGTSRLNGGCTVPVDPTRDFLVTGRSYDFPSYATADSLPLRQDRRKRPPPVQYRSHRESLEANT